MIPISINIVKAAIAKNSKALKNYTDSIRDALTVLEGDPLLDNDQKRYISAILSKCSNLLTATPDTLRRYKNNFDTIIHPDDIAHSDNKDFRQNILTALGYEKRRKDFYPEYFSMLGIKACVYCNSQLAVTVKKAKGKPKAKFQVDHYIPKNKYPGLSVSLFNLYPSCASCNNVKGVKTVSFKLYEPHQLNYKSQYKFQLKPGVKSKFLSSRDINDIKFLFTEPKPRRGDDKFNDLFDIEGIYETQLDVIEELFMKAEIYTKPYRDTLKTSFPKLLPTDQVFDRLLIGNYS
ncbi:MAG: HNH endonuclease, partial [Chitinophagaceae bacterium]|nr:HNH endonuclease [Chitinophagaceae bacterium]